MHLSVSAEADGHAQACAFKVKLGKGKAPVYRYCLQHEPCHVFSAHPHSQYYWLLNSSAAMGHKQPIRCIITLR